MKIIMTATLAAGLLMAGQANAADELALAKAKNCMTCHTVDKKLIGPGYKEVAAKYKDDKTAKENLAAKIRAGGAGVWGATPMPPNNVTKKEAKRLAAWVLSLK